MFLLRAVPHQWRCGCFNARGTTHLPWGLASTDQRGYTRVETLRYGIGILVCGRVSFITAILHRPRTLSCNVESAKGFSQRKLRGQGTKFRFPEGGRGHGCNDRGNIRKCTACATSKVKQDRHLKVHPQIHLWHQNGIPSGNRMETTSYGVIPMQRPA